MLRLRGGAGRASARGLLLALVLAHEACVRLGGGGYDQGAAWDDGMLPPMAQIDPVPLVWSVLTLGSPPAVLDGLTWNGGRGRWACAACRPELTFEYWQGRHRPM